LNFVILIFIHVQSGRCCDYKQYNLSLQAEFDENCLKGVLDQLILIQKQEVGTDDPVMDDGAIEGIMADLIVGGICMV